MLRSAAQAIKGISRRWISRIPKRWGDSQPANQDRNALCVARADSFFWLKKKVATESMGRGHSMSTGIP
jgi:hypothetical protein